MAEISRFRRLADRIRREGAAGALSSLAARMANAYAPPALFSFRRGILVASDGMAWEWIPVLGCASSRRVMADECQELKEVSAAAAAHPEFFANGSICTAAVWEGKLAAVAWACVGPRDCVVDDSYRHGFRFLLEKGEAWLHNGEAREDLRGTGIYLAAYRRLLEELASMGVRRCYGRVGHDNTVSLKVHRRLGLHPIAEFQYLRLAGVGFYEWRSEARSGSTRITRPSLTVRPADFLPTKKPDLAAATI